MNVKPMSNDLTFFDNDYLCQMLSSASDEQLNNILLEVCKEQHNREAIRQGNYTSKIREAIRDAIRAGYEINFYFHDYSDDEDHLPDLTIHSNNAIYMNINLTSPNPI